MKQFKLKSLTFAKRTFLQIRMGDFWKFLATNLLTKVAKNGLFKKINLCKNFCEYDLGAFFIPTPGHTEQWQVGK